MLFLLRNIRRKLLTRNKVITYLLYAVGEIFLVVVGILIAVQIDNWNDNRKKNEQIRGILMQVSSELELDIERIRSVNAFFLNKDSLISVYKNTDFDEIGSLSEEERWQLFNLIRTYEAFTPHDKGLQLLMSKVDEIENQHKNITEDLSFLYQDVIELINTHKVGLHDMLRQHRDYKLQSFSWYSDMYLHRKIGQEELDYYMFDPMYKNFMALYRMHLINIVANGRIFEDVASKIHRRIEIERTGNYNNMKGLWKQAPESLLGYLEGQFVAETDTIIFQTKDLQLTMLVDQAAFKLKSDGNEIILRYKGDSTFYFDADRDLKIASDGSVSLISFFDWPNIPLKRID